MKSQDDQVYPVPGEPGVFSSSLMLRAGASAASSIMECLVARRVAPGRWQVKKRSCSLSPNGAMQMHPPKEKPVTVDANTAYEMLKAHEAARDVPADDKGRTFPWAQHFSKMEGIARRARYETAKKAGGLPKRIRLSRNRNRNRNRSRKPKAL